MSAKWTSAEDSILRDLRSKGTSWDNIAEHLPGRGADGIARRYSAIKDIKGKARSSLGSKLWSDEETALLLELQRDDLGWEEISERIPGRSVSACKNRLRQIKSAQPDETTYATPRRSGRVRTSSSGHGPC
jgi:hypothetical protein